MNVLDVPMGANDADAETIKDYLKALLKELWNAGEGFSGKRPFGNSGWDYELIIPLAKAGLIEATFDEYGDIIISRDEERKGEQLIFEAIDAL